MGLAVLGGCLALLAGVFAAGSAGVAEKPKESAENVLAGMRRELGDGFRYRVVRCFAVASDGETAEFDRICRYTLGDCYDAYEKQFFKERPTEVYRVYLFKDDASYRTHAKELFGDVPDTPFGYYLDGRRALVMNIATGGGTLVHEMFHALVRVDFPGIPAWANEGLGSLFEQCRVTDEGLVGLVNWRLPILQEAIRKEEIGSLRKIMTLDDAGFYAARGGNYAAARYFMMYLQENRRLVDFYTRFRDQFAKDKTGVRFAEEVLGRKLEEVEPEWRKWVMGLRASKTMTFWLRPATTGAGVVGLPRRFATV
jgi:hypothetical protein